jgi:cAMP-dependent protein kinase regulator
MRQTYGDRVTQSGDRKQYEHLKAEVKRLEAMLVEKQRKEKEESKSVSSGAGAAHEARSIGSENETDEDDEDDYLETLPEKVVNKHARKGPRSSVSAEAFGAWNKKSEFKPRIVEKSEDTKEKIRNRLKHSFMF